MRTNANLWAIHPESVDQYLAHRRERAAVVRAETEDEKRKRDAREHAMRGQVRMGSAADAERAWYPINVVGRTALVHVAGVMVKGGDPYWGEICTLEVRRSIEAAESDPDIDAIVMRLDTPGGSVDGLAELGDAVYSAAQSKRIIAQVDGMCCSAGYYVASQADEIRSGRMDTIGSIGTRMMLYDFSKMFEEFGIRPVPIDTGPFKSLGARGMPITDEQVKFLQEYVDAFFADFLQMIGRGRPGLAGERIKGIADGRFWDALTAIDLGLVDHLGTLDDTLAELAAASQQVAAETNTRRARLQLMERGG